MKTFAKRFALPLTMLAGAAFTTIPTIAAAEWQPKKPIDFVIMAGKGGGADKMARLMQSIVEKHGLSSKPLIPVNKSGGSGAEALIALKGKTGDAHTIMVTLNSFYTTPIRQPGLNVDSMSFAPIARMAEDTFLLWVNKDSGITNLDEFVAAAKAAGKDFSMAGTGKGAEDSILVDFLNSTFGLTINYIPQKGGGAVAKQLAGNQVQASVNNPSEALGFYEAGTVMPIASFTAERLPLFPDVPTFTELGFKFSYYMQRSVVGAPGMDAEVEAYYRELFTKVFESEEWQEYRTKKSLGGDFMTGDELKAYWTAQIATHKTLLGK